jgi:hypothetical protein
MYRILITAFALAFLFKPNFSAADSTSDAKPKSKRAALTRSLICMLVPVAVGGALVLHGSSGDRNDKVEALAGFAIGSGGMVFGPGMGLAYAEKKGRFWNGVAIRGAASALTAIISFSISENSYSISEGIAQSSMALAVGGSVCLASAIIDISAIGTSIDGYNKKHCFSSLTLRPTYSAAHKAPGLLLRLTF